MSDQIHFNKWHKMINFCKLSSIMCIIIFSVVLIEKKQSIINYGLKNIWVKKKCNIIFVLCVIIEKKQSIINCGLKKYMG